MGQHGCGHYKRLVRHIVHHLALVGVADFVLDNGWMSFAQSREGEIRRNLIEADAVDCTIVEATQPSRNKT